MIGNTFFFGWEVNLILFLQAHLIQYTSILIGITYLGEGIALIAVIGFLYWCYDKKAGQTICLIIALGLLLNPMIKNIFLRRRPYFDIKSIKCLKAAESSYPANSILGQGFSLPSLAATNTVMSFGYLAYVIKKTWAYILAIIIILLVGLSRVFLGVHFPTDVLIGWLLGLISIVVILTLQSKIKNKNIIYLILLIIGLIGLTFAKSTDYYRSFGLLIGAIISFTIEEKYINFKNTKNIKRIIIRLIGGIIVFAIPYLGLKLILPIGTDLIGSISYALQYMIAIIIGLAIYPMIFKKFDKYFKEPQKDEQK